MFKKIIALLKAKYQEVFFIGTDDNNNFLYPFNDCVNLIEKLKEVKLDLDDAGTLKDLFYISDIIDVGNTIASDYTALNLKL